MLGHSLKLMVVQFISTFSYNFKNKKGETKSHITPLNLTIILKSFKIVILKVSLLLSDTWSFTGVDALAKLSALTGLQGLQHARLTILWWR